MLLRGESFTDYDSSDIVNIEIDSKEIMGNGAMISGYFKIPTT